MKSWIKRLVDGFNLPVVLVLVPVVLLAALGALLLGLLDHSGTAGAGSWFKRHLVFGAVGMCVMLGLAMVPYQKIGRWSYGLLGLAVILLAVVLAGKAGVPIARAICPEVNFAYRWIRVGPVQFQPSEFAKIAFILALAWFLRYRSNYRRLTGLVGPFVVTLVPMGLILLEPDLGTVLLFLPVLFVMLFAAGARVKHLMLVVCLGLLSVPLFFTVMKDYQRRRIVGMLLQSSQVRAMLSQRPGLKHYLYPNKSLSRWKLESEGYQLGHSKQALGSGMLLGQGLGKGPYMSRPRLPHGHNDFIFAIMGHQLGFLGAILAILGYLVFAFGGIEIAGNTDDPFGRLVAVGVVAMIVTQAFINMAMTMGLMPITGMTLPFVSYGGSSLVSSMALVGLLISVNTHRPVIIAPKPFEFREDQ